MARRLFSASETLGFGVVLSEDRAHLAVSDLVTLCATASHYPGSPRTDHSKPGPFLVLRGPGWRVGHKPSEALQHV